MFKRSTLIIGAVPILLMAPSTGTIIAVTKAHDAQPAPTMTPYTDPIATATASVTLTVSPTSISSPTTSLTPQPEIPKGTAKPTPPV